MIRGVEAADHTIPKFHRRHHGNSSPRSCAQDATKKTHRGWEERNPAKIPATVQLALREALKIEGVSSSEFNDFLWIMAQETEGRVGARNSRSSARGLFQLLRAQYHLNPNGEASFGNAIEECQGGIRYMAGRYRTAAAARAFWKKYHWY